jgi:hypothetical protein
MPTSDPPTPHWHPIAALPLIARVIDGQLEAAEEQHGMLLQAKPGSLDTATVERVVRVFTEEVDLLGVNQEQLDRWRMEPLTAAQGQEVERLRQQVARNREVATAILALTEELKSMTIEAILGKSDLELGLELLAGRSLLFSQELPPSRRPLSPAATFASPERAEPCQSGDRAPL